MLGIRLLLVLPDMLAIVVFSAIGLKMLPLVLERAWVASLFSVPIQLEMLSIPLESFSTCQVDSTLDLVVFYVKPGLLSFLSFCKSEAPNWFLIRQTQTLRSIVVIGNAFPSTDGSSDRRFTGLVFLAPHVSLNDCVSSPPFACVRRPPTERGRYRFSIVAFTADHCCY